MSASKAEQVLSALKALLETVPNASVQRNSVLPEKIPSGGLIILRDGDPGEPEQALGGFGSAYYQHAVEIEVYVEEGDAAVRDAAFDSLLQQIGDSLESDPTLVTSRLDWQGLTPLHLAAQQNQLHTAQVLLEFGADVNAADDRGRTPLHAAASCDSDEMVELLLSNGADPLAVDSAGRTPHDVAREAWQMQNLGIFESLSH